MTGQGADALTDNDAFTLAWGRTAAALRDGMRRATLQPYRIADRALDPEALRAAIESMRVELPESAGPYKYEQTANEYRGTFARAFCHVRDRQIRYGFGREPTPIDRMAGYCVMHAALAAQEDSRRGFSTVSIRALAMSTGTGKSTSAAAFIATGMFLDPDFTAVYVVPTAKLAEEVQQEIERLTGYGTTTLWTSYHDAEGRADRDKVFEALGHLPIRLATKSELRGARVAIVTHRAWKSELASERHRGIRRFGEHCEERLRDVCYVDEHPELCEVIVANARDIAELHDIVARNAKPDSAAHGWLPILRETVSHLMQLGESTGQRFEPTRVLNEFDVVAIDDADMNTMLDFVPPDASDSVRRSRANAMLDTLRFVRVAATGAAFYSRADNRVFAYRFDFDSGPGNVLLDATGDITGLVALRGNEVEFPCVPPVRFDRLDVVHASTPKGFRNASEVLKTKLTTIRYVRWMRALVLQHTDPGEEVLLCCHKGFWVHGHLGGPDATASLLNAIENGEDPNGPYIEDGLLAPLRWEGRRVWVFTWGSGVGINKWSHIRKVFAVGEFHRKRAVTVGETHGWSGLPLAAETLKAAEGTRTHGNTYKPSGPYLGPHEGHLLRWAKQGPMRGNARNFDARGVCGEMLLVTTMDRTRLLENMHRLFPHAPPPRPNPPLSEAVRAELELTPEQAHDALIRLLMSEGVGPSRAYSSADLGALLRQRTDTVKRTLDRADVKAVRAAYGWTVAKASAVGKAGKGYWLVNRSYVSGLSSGGEKNTVS